MDITYENYLRSFYPHQEENVFTHNNWTLSDEFVQLCQANSFYKNHVRWNIQRFRPTDLNQNVAAVDAIIESSETAATIPTGSTGITTSNCPQMSSEEPLITESRGCGMTTQMSLRSVNGKRKISNTHSFTENPTCSRARRMKRN